MLCMHDGMPSNVHAHPLFGFLLLQSMRIDFIRHAICRSLIDPVKSLHIERSRDISTRSYVVSKFELEIKQLNERGK